MKSLKVILTSALLPFVMVGCATSNGGHGISPAGCAVIGTAVGAGLGAGATGGPGGAIGAVTGLVMSQLFCGQDEELDSDGDGVPDDRDECPNTPAGVAVGENGCPLDSDGDGMADIYDACPNELGKGPDGCPEEMVMEEVVVVKIVETVHFAFDSAKIEPIGKAVLDARVVPALRANPDVAIRIVGFTDSTGPAEYNLGLSLRRAESIRDYLVSQGISITRLSVIGKGEEFPIASNTTREGRADNRRVEFEIKQ